MDHDRVTGSPGFCLSRTFQRPDPGCVADLSGIPVALLGDSLGRRGIMDAGIKPLAPGTRLCGPALTVETRPGDNLMLHAALKLAQPGDVLVVNGGGYAAAALWGMLMTTTAMAVKLGGLVVDGAVRDSAEIARSGFPVFSRWICPAGPHKDGPGQINQPITCGGVPVLPGDVIVGDDDGLIVIPQAWAGEAAGTARKREAAEARRTVEIREEGKHHQSWLEPTLRAKGLLGPDETL